MPFDPSTASPDEQFDPTSATPDNAPPLRAVLSTAVATNPQQAAQAAKLAKKLSTSDEMVLRNLQDVQLRDAVNEYDKKLQTSPALADYLRTSPFVAKQAHADIDPLVQMHGELKAWNGPEPTAENIVKGLAQSLPQGFRSMRAGMQAQMGDFLEWAGVVEHNPVYKADQQRKLAQAVGAKDFTTPNFETATARGVYGGLDSTLRMLPGLAGSVATRSSVPLLASIGVQTEAEAYGKYRARGADPLMALAGGAGEAAVEVGTELPAMKFLTGAIGRTGVGEFVTGLLARELPMEQVATFFQDAIDTAIANPDKTWDQFVAERPGAAYETLVSTLTQSALMGGVSEGARRLAKRSDDQQKAQADAQRLQAAMQTAAAVKLREANPETFRDLVNHMAENTEGAPKSVFIDAQVLQQAVQGMAPEALAQAFPSLADQLDAALATNSSVELPIGEVLAAVPGTPLEQVFMQNSRSAPDALSLADAEQAAKQAEEFIKSEADRVMVEATDQQKWADEVAGVEQTIRDQLNAAGRFSESVNEGYAKLQGAFFSTMASRLGLTPSGMYQRYALRVAGAGQQGAVLDQVTPAQAMQTNVPVELPTAPEFTEAVGNTPWAQVTENGLLLDLVRFQKQEQEGAQAIRTGVFYLPAKSADVKHYRNAKTGYGGGERFAGETLIRRPLFVKGATGGAAPEQAYRELKGKDAFAEMSRAVTQTITRGGNYMRPDPALKLQLIEEFLDQYAPESVGLAREIERVSREGNTLRYALQEIAVAHAVRAAGYDAVVGYSKGKAGARISEVFDVREQTFPARGMGSEIHEDYLNQQPAQPLPATIEIDGKQRPTVNSNGQPIAATEEGVRNFWKWFGDSKVVDASGKPLVVYHGSGNLPESFDANARRRLYGMDEGAVAYFTDDVNNASGYASARAAYLTTKTDGKKGVLYDGASVAPIYLKFDAPLEVDAAGSNWDSVPFEGKKRNRPSVNDLGPIARERGSDSLIVRNVRDNVTGINTAGTTFVAFSPNQIKSAIGNRGAFDPQDANILNQSVVDERNLIVAHNLSADNLRNALEIGGLPAPSLAITKVDAPIQGFGEITLVGDSSMATPSAKNPVFNADVYSPRFPDVKVKVDDRTVVRSLESLYVTAKEAGLYAPDPSRIAEELGRNQFNRAVGDIVSDAGMRYGYATEVLGKKIEVPKKEVQPAPTAKAGAPLIEQSPLRELLPAIDLGKLTPDTAGDLGQKVYAALVNKTLADAGENGDFDKAMVLVNRRIQLFAESSIASGSAEFAPEKVGKMTVKGLYSLYNVVRNSAKAEDSAPSVPRVETDFKRLNEILDAEVDTEQMRQWVQEKLRPTIGEKRIVKEDGKTVAFSLANIVKSMTRKVRDAEGFNYGLGNARSKGAKAFKSLSEVQAQRDQVQGADDAKAAIKANEDRFGDLVTEFESYLPESSSMYAPSAYDALVDAVGLSYASGAATALREAGFKNVPAKLVKDLERFAADLVNLPTEYFEAKPQRAVGVNEFKGAVIPDSTPADVREALTAQGLELVEYVKGDEQSRSQAVRQLSELLDSRTGSVMFQNAQAPRGTYSPSQVLITLGEKADLSTFLHESGHFFLEVMADLASQPNAPQQIVDDMSTLLKWFGIKGDEQVGGVDSGVPLAQMAAGSESLSPELSTAIASVFEKAGGTGDINESENITAKSLAFAEMARREGFEVSDPGAKYFRVFKDLGEDADGYRREISLQVRVSDHSNVNRGVHFGESVINIAPDDGYPRDTFESALWKLRNADVNSDLDVTIAGELVDNFVFAQDGNLPVDNTQPAGRTPLEVWNAMTLDQKRPYHEKLAESFEAYLFEGKAPSQELKPLFRRFRQWLTNVYRSLTDFMRGRNLEISPEVKQVFDRMLATDEQIKQAEEVNGMLPDFDATNEAIEKLQSRSLRDLKWTINARSKALKALQRQASDVRKAVEAEVRAEVEQMREFRAQAEIAKLKKELKRKPNDAELATIADSFGFAGADEMGMAIAEAGKKSDMIEGKTDQRMLENFGELSTPEALEEAANDAVHNEARARALAAELKAQAEALNPREDTGRTSTRGSKITVNALIQAAKQFADDVTGRTKVKNLKGNAFKHRAAEARASKLWSETTAKGNTAEAVAAKRDQMLNNYTAKAMAEAQTEVKKIADFFAKVTKGNDEKVVERGRDPDVVNAMRAILAAYNVAPRLSKAANDYMETVKTNDPAMYAALADDVNNAVANAKPMDELTVDELRALSDSLQSMWVLAKRSRQMEVDGDLIDLQDAADDLMGRMTDIGIPDEIPGEKSAITSRQELGIKLRYAKAFLSRAEQWAERMDGKFGGPFLRLVFQPIKKAADSYRTDRQIYREKFTNLVKALPPLPAGEIKAPELGYTFGSARDSGTAELLHAILHTGNDSNKRKLLLGRQWATENADKTLDTSRWDAFISRMIAEGKIEKAHYDFAQGVWDLLESMKPMAQETHRRVYGRYFSEVTANEVTTPFGVYRGGYVPAISDSRIVQDQKVKQMLEAENEALTNAFPSAPKGFTKSRVEYNRPLLLDLRVLTQHMDKVLLFSHMQGAVTDVRRLLGNKKVAYALDRVDPGAYEGMLLPWLDRSAKQIVETPIMGDRKWSRFAGALRSRAGMAMMFGNLSNTVQQVTGFSLAAVKVKPSLMLKATADFAARPAQFKKAVVEASPFMRDRMLNEVSAMNNVMEELLLNPSLMERGQAWTQRHAYFLQSAVDNTMAPIIWTAAYNQGIEQGMSESDAIKFADGTIRQTQGSTLPEDVSRFETGTAVARLFSQFIGYFNMMANTNATAVAQTVEEMGVRKGAGRLMYIALTGLLVPIWVAEAIAQAFRGGPDDEDDDGYLDDWLMAVFGLGTIRGMVAQVPIVGMLAQSVVNRFNGNPADDKFSLSPAVSLVESAAGSPASVYKAIMDEGSAQKAIRDTAAAATLITGLPFYAAARPVGYAAGVAQDKIEPTSSVDAVRGVITGTASPESRQP